MTTISLHVGRGEHRGALSVFPIWRQFDVGPEVALADSGDLQVAELREPSVPHLQVTATGRRLVLLLDGDLLVGGWQNRVAFGSRLLAPGRPTTVNVRCVESDRWNGDTDHAVGGRASSFVRGNPDQQEVWRRVAVEQNHSHQPPNVRGLVPIPGQSGVMFGFGGTPTLVELFATDLMLAAAWPRILAAAAQEAAGRPEKPTAGWRARKLVAVIDGMHIMGDPQVGETVLSAINGHIELRGIADAEGLLHASIISREVSPA